MPKASLWKARWMLVTARTTKSYRLRRKSGGGAVLQGPLKRLKADMTCAACAAWRGRRISSRLVSRRPLDGS